MPAGSDYNCFSLSTQPLPDGVTVGSFAGTSPNLLVWECGAEYLTQPSNSEQMLFSAI